jgi:tetratricopeptide (TPR) repeat protein
MRSLNQPSLQGYATIGDLDNLETGNRQFDIEHGLAMMRRSTDVSERKKRLESIDLAIRTNPLVTSEESDNIYLEISENYLQLLPADPAKAEEYLQRVEGRLLSSERAQRQREMIQSIREKLTPTVRSAPEPSSPTPPQPTQTGVPISDLVNAAKINLNNGRSLEQTGDAAAAKDQYVAAISRCERILKIDPKNAEARTICQDAKDAAGAINRSETPR